MEGDEKESKFLLNYFQLQGKFSADQLTEKLKHDELLHIEMSMM